MSVEPPDALQEQVGRGKVRDQQIRVHIERLLGELRGDHHHAVRPLLAGPWAHQSQALFGPFRAVGRAQPTMQQSHLPLKTGLCQGAVNSLGSVDLVHHHQHHTAVGYLFPHRRGNQRPVLGNVRQPVDPRRHRRPPGQHHFTRTRCQWSPIESMGNSDTWVTGWLRHRTDRIRRAQST